MIFIKIIILSLPIYFIIGIFRRRVNLRVFGRGGDRVIRGARAVIFSIASLFLLVFILIIQFDNIGFKHSDLFLLPVSLFIAILLTLLMDPVLYYDLKKLKRKLINKDKNL
jgi:hypothetical protein